MIVNEEIGEDLQVFSDKLKIKSIEELSDIKETLETKAKESIGIKNMLLNYFKDEEEYHNCLKNLYLIIEKINSMILVVSTLMEDKLRDK